MPPCVGPPERVSGDAKNAQKIKNKKKQIDLFYFLLYISPGAPGGRARLPGYEGVISVLMDLRIGFLSMG